MKIVKFGITLRKLKYEDLEVVRGWRNSADIRKKMIYQEYISKKEQAVWFESIDNRYNLYFLIIPAGNKKGIGVGNLKNINEKEQSAEGGLYIHDKHYLNSDVSFRVSIILYDFIFTNYKIDKIKIQVLSDNIKAVRFNESLGFIYKNKELIDNKEINNYVLTKEGFYLKCSKIMNLFNKLYTEKV